MRIYIFKRCKVSTRYHSSGGLVVIARDLDDVKHLISEYNDLQHPADPEDDPHVGETAIELTEQDFTQALVIDCVRSPQARRDVIVFPNAGCC